MFLTGAIIMTTVDSVINCRQVPLSARYKMWVGGEWWVGWWVDDGWVGWVRCWSREWVTGQKLVGKYSGRVM